MPLKLIGHLVSAADDVLFEISDADVQRVISLHNIIRAGSSRFIKHELDESYIANIVVAKIGDIDIYAVIRDTPSGIIEIGEYCHGEFFSIYSGDNNLLLVTDGKALETYNENIT